MTKCNFIVAILQKYLQSRLQKLHIVSKNSYIGVKIQMCSCSAIICVSHQVKELWFIVHCTINIYISNEFSQLGLGSTLIWQEIGNMMHFTLYFWCQRNTQNNRNKRKNRATKLRNIKNAKYFLCLTRAAESFNLQANNQFSLNILTEPFKYNFQINL